MQALYILYIHYTFLYYTLWTVESMDFSSVKQKVKRLINIIKVHVFLTFTAESHLII